MLCKSFSIYDVNYCQGYLPEIIEIFALGLFYLTNFKKVIFIIFFFGRLQNHFNLSKAIAEHFLSQ